MTTATRRQSQNSIDAYRRFASAPRSLSRVNATVIHVCGVPASGKSWLSSRIGAALDIPVFGIDEERLAVLVPGEWWPRDDAECWLSLERKIDAVKVCVVETSGRSPCDSILLRWRRVYSVVCIADIATRRRRLEERVEAGHRFTLGREDYVSRLLSSADPVVLFGGVPFDTSDGRSHDEALTGVIARMRAALQ